MQRKETEPDGRTIARTLLTTLLDRLERVADPRRRIMGSTPQSLLSEQRRQLDTVLVQAQEAGAVTLVRDRLSNRIDRVILADSKPLYQLLDRQQPEVVAQRAAVQLKSKLPALPDSLARALEEIVDGWTAKRNIIRDIGPADLDQAEKIFRCATALLDISNRMTDIRSFSSEVVADSKFVEQNVGRIADVLKLAVEIPAGTSALQVLASFGIEKYTMPCILTGPITYKSLQLPTHPYIGIPGEMVSDLGIASAPLWILLIENWTSFNRQIREIVEPNGIVVYTGGFPSDVTLNTIITIVRLSNCPIYHWGDIDAGGVKIAYRIEHALENIGRRLSLHLMTPELAKSSGMKSQATRIFRDACDPNSCVEELTRFLASDQAYVLEQEAIAPTRPAVKTGRAHHML
jgi:hypothetical protein